MNSITLNLIRCYLAQEENRRVELVELVQSHRERLAAAEKDLADCEAGILALTSDLPESV